MFNFSRDFINLIAQDLVEQVDLLINDHDFGMNDARVSLVDQLPDVDQPRLDVWRPQLPEVGRGVAGVVHELDVVADAHRHVPVEQS